MQAYGQHMILKRYVKQGGAMKWIDVNDEKPFPGQRVIATDGDSVDMAEFDMVNWYSCDSDGESYLSMNDITHWMELPKPPASHNSG